MFLYSPLYSTWAAVVRAPRVEAGKERVRALLNVLQIYVDILVTCNSQTVGPDPLRRVTKRVLIKFAKIQWQIKFVHYFSMKVFICFFALVRKNKISFCSPMNLWQGVMHIFFILIGCEAKYWESTYINVWPGWVHRVHSFCLVQVKMWHFFSHW